MNYLKHCNDKSKATKEFMCSDILINFLKVTDNIKEKILEIMSIVTSTEKAFNKSKNGKYIW